MPDTQNSLNISNKDWNGAYVPKHTAKLIKAGIENGTAPFIPNNGQLKPSLVFNVNTGHALEAKDLIPVILTKVEKGYESNAVGTFKSSTKADTRIAQGEKGVYYNFKDSNGKYSHNAFFFGEQMEQPERFAEYAKKNFKQAQNLSKETLVIASPEVSEYLGTYVAACKSGAKVEVTPEIAEQFKTNILAVAENELKRTNAEKNPQIPKLSDLLFEVEKKSSAIVKNREKELGIETKPQHQLKKQERKQERSQSMSF